MDPLRRHFYTETIAEGVIFSTIAYLASSSRFTKITPALTKQGIFLIEGSLFFSSFLYNFCRENPLRSNNQRFLEKAFLFSVTTLVVSRFPPSYTTLTLATITLLFSTLITKLTIPSLSPIQNLELQKKLLGENHLDVATSLNNIGLTSHVMGKYPEALNYLQQALEIRQKQLRGDHLDVATSLNDIGLTSHVMGKYPEALNYLQQALEIRQKHLGENHLDVAIIYSNMIRVHIDYKHNPQDPPFKKWLESAVAIVSKIECKDHPDIAHFFDTLGLIFMEEKIPKEAIEWMNQALRIRMKLFLNDEHLDLAHSYHNLGLAKLKAGHYKSAHENIIKALKIRNKFLEEDHPDIASSYHSLGLLYHVHGESISKGHLTSSSLGTDFNTPDSNYSEAAESMKKALKIREKLWEEEHPDVMTSYNQLGLVYQSQKNPQALESFEKALRIGQTLFPYSTHLEIAISYENLGNLHTLLESYSLALEYMKLAHQEYIKVYGSSHKLVGCTLGNISSIYLKMNNHDEGKRYFFLSSNLANTWLLNDIDKNRIYRDLLSLLSPAIRNE